MWSKWATRSEKDAFGLIWAMARSMACFLLLSRSGTTIGLLMTAFGRFLNALTSSSSSSSEAALRFLAVGNDVTLGGGLSLSLVTSASINL